MSKCIASNLILGSSNINVSKPGMYLVLSLLSSSLLIGGINILPFSITTNHGNRVIMCFIQAYLNGKHLETQNFPLMLLKDIKKRWELIQLKEDPSHKDFGIGILIIMLTGKSEFTNQ